MKHVILYSLIFLIGQKAVGQQNYIDFEGNKVITFGDRTGTLDSMFTNPAPNAINNSPNCGMYIRDSSDTYDNFKLYTLEKMLDVTPYASAATFTPKMKMKLYTSANAGTIINLQLGTKNDNTYPSGVHSEYVGQTTVKNAWQNITFNYYQSTPGSTTSATNVDKMAIFFKPGYNTEDTIYFDDVLGPNLILSGINEMELSSFKLYQNQPNPAKERTFINFQLSSSGMVSLKLYDLLGNLIAAPVEQQMKNGMYSIPVETENIPNGIYFYILKKDGTSRSMKMIISK